MNALRVLLASGLLVLACGALPSAAEEAKAPPRGFSWTGTVRHLGKPVARLRLVAVPTAPGALSGAPDGAAWHVLERLEPTQPQMDAQQTQAWLDADLHALSGSYRRSNDGGFLAATWSKREGGFVLEHQTPEYENHLEPASAGPAVTTTVGLLLWLQAQGAAADGRSIADFDPDPAPGDPYVAPLHVESHGAVRWRQGDEVRELQTLSITRAQRTLRFAFDADGTLAGFEIVGLGLDVTEGDGEPLVLDDPEGLAQSLRDRATEAARAARRCLDAPAKAWRFEGDLVLDGATIGSVVLEAVPASAGGEPAWDVREVTERAGGDAQVRSELVCTLAQDLTVLRGQRSHSSPSEVGHSRFERAGDVMHISHEVDGRPPVTLDGAVRPDATMGTVAALLLARLATPTSGAAHWVLPGFDPRFARAPKAGSGSVATGEADLTVDVSTSEDGVRTVRVRSRLGFETVYRLRAADGELLGADGVLPRSGIVPKGQGGPAPDWYDAIEGTPKNAWQAFIRFGRGYHLPRRDLLEVAFDWEALRAHEIEAGHWAADTPIETVRDGWIQEFESRSKHRTTGDCDDLLMQIFLTMQLIREPDGSFTFATLPVYGGHRYRIADGGEKGWRIVRID